MTTKYIEVNKGYAVIRLDQVAEETLITVYNVNIKDIDALIEKLQGVKDDFTPKANITVDEPPQMTAVLGPKPMALGERNPAAWYGKALANAVAPSKAAKSIQPAIIQEPLPPMPQRQRGKGITNVMSVTSRRGEMYPLENADIVKNQSIRIYGIAKDQTRWDKENQRHVRYSTAYDRTFKMGDTVEYGSFNFAYTGKIVAIGEKTVKVEHGHGEKVTQLDLHTFIWRNWDLDLAKIANDRANWYD